MPTYIALLAGFGAITLLTVWLPQALRRAPLSLPMICVAIGAVVFSPSVTGLSLPDLKADLAVVERITEFLVILSLMGAGLKIDRPMSAASWRLTWRLLGIAMPVTIVLFAVVSAWLLGLGLASAVLLAAVLAPTDPVLASDVQLSAPNSEKPDDTRFALTSEAGLNDGLAFPGVMLAIALASTADGDPWFWRWFSIDVAWRVTMGFFAGWALGKALGWLTFRLPSKTTLAKTGDGLVAVGATCLVYGLTEMMNGYGFLAVFIMALGLRSEERGHEYHETLHEFAEQIERVLMMVVLVVFGGALVATDIFSPLPTATVMFGIAAICIVRPISGFVSLIGSPTPLAERVAISVYGIRGLGSVYYLAYAAQKADFTGIDTIWTTVAFTIVLSIVLHGVTVTPVMRLIDRKQGRVEAE